MITEYFDIRELVCPHVYKAFGQKAWKFFDSRLLANILAVRQRINAPFTANNYHTGGKWTQRGLRCTQCAMVEEAVKEGKLYMSAHILGKALDFDVQGRTAEEVRQYIINNKNLWPYPLRLEAGVNWVHLDTAETEEKVNLFNP